VIPHIGKTKYYTESTETLSIHGDAPKCFLHMKEYGEGVRRPGERPRWISYIAKVGSKWYPGESITEHMLTQVGICFGVNVAHSHLRFVGDQVRFLSRYFLRPTEQLVHGIEIFKHYLDDEMVEKIAEARAEQEFYTFQTVCDAMRYAFPEVWGELMEGLVAMLAFDALVGHNDRHPANWGVIVPIMARATPRFSPIYDTARALFWNDSEAKIVNRLANEHSFEAYIRGSRPQIGWDGKAKVGHFDLIRLISEEFREYGPVFARFREPERVDRVQEMLERDFDRMMSKERMKLIGGCLRRRHQLLGEALS